MENDMVHHATTTTSVSKGGTQSKQPLYQALVAVPCYECLGLCGNSSPTRTHPDPWLSMIVIQATKTRLRVQTIHVGIRADLLSPHLNKSGQSVETWRYLYHFIASAGNTSEVSVWQNRVLLRLLLPNKDFYLDINSSTIRGMERLIT